MKTDIKQRVEHARSMRGCCYFRARFINKGPNENAVVQKGFANRTEMPCRGAKVLHVVKDPELLANAALLEHCCRMNMENWAYVPPHMQSDEIFYAMLRSPFNAPNTTACPIPPLVLQLGAKEDCDDTERVFAAVKHSGYNLQFASKRLRADAMVVAWAAATQEVKKVTLENARDIDCFCDSRLNQPAPSIPGVGYKGPSDQAPRIPHDEWSETCKLRVQEIIAKLSLTDSCKVPEGFPVSACKAQAYFTVPEPIRQRLWPWRESCRKIFTELQWQGKMPGPPADNERKRPMKAAAFENFRDALFFVLRETHPELLAYGCRNMHLHSVAYVIWSELSAEDKARWARRA